MNRLLSCILSVLWTLAAFIVASSSDSFDGFHRRGLSSDPLETSSVITGVDIHSDAPGAHYHIYSPYHQLPSVHSRHNRHNHIAKSDHHQSMHGMTATKPLLATPEYWIQSLSNFHQHLDQVTVSMDNKPSLSTFRRAQRAYLEMLQLFVLGNVYGNAEKSMKLDGSLQYTEYNATKRHMGEDMTYLGTTMIGVRRLQALEDLIVRVIDQDIKGDIVETGVWRGGASIYALAVLRAYSYISSIHSSKKSTTHSSKALANDLGSDMDEKTNEAMRSVHFRRVYLCDSFAGLPPGNKALHQGDVGWNGLTYLSVSDEEVIRHIQEFNVMDPRVVIVKGFFNESIPALQQSVLIQEKRQISILRLDGDMYESTMDVLYHVYHLVTVGGFVIVDDWEGFPAKDACEDFFRVHQIQPQIVPVDRWSVYFQKTQQIEIQYWRYVKKQFK